MNPKINNYISRPMKKILQCVIAHTACFSRLSELMFFNILSSIYITLDLQTVQYVQYSMYSTVCTVQYVQYSMYVNHQHLTLYGLEIRIF